MTAACTGSSPDSLQDGSTSTSGSVPVVQALDPAVSLNDDGQALYAASSAQERPRPRYDVVATVEPETGDVHGTLTAELPTPAGGTATFRFFPGLPDLDAEPRIGDVEVDGQTVAASWTPRSSRSPSRTRPTSVLTVTIPFGYTLPEHESAGPLDGLLGTACSPPRSGCWRGTRTR